MAFIGAGAGFGSEPATVVFYGENNFFAAERQMEQYPGSAGMFDGVGHGFLAAAQNVFLDDFRQWANFAFGFNLNPNGSSIRDLISADEQRGGQIELFQFPRS